MDAAVPHREGTMFIDFYSLGEDPFDRTDPRFIYLSANHRKALAALHYGIERGERVQLLLADAGLGKTTMLRHLEIRLQSYARVTLISAADFNTSALLKHPEGGREKADRTGKIKTGSGNHSLSPNSANKASQRLIVLVDDAHELGDAELASMASAATLASSADEDRHFILSGRPRLVEKLRKINPANAFREVAIAPMSTDETREYINHRLRIASGSQPAIFTPAAYVMIAARSGGIPRVVNAEGTKALTAGAQKRLMPIDTSLLARDDSDAGKHFVLPRAEAATPASWPLSKSLIPAWPWLALGLALIAGAGTGIWYANKGALRSAPVAVVDDKANALGLSRTAAAVAPLPPLGIHADMSLPVPHPTVAAAGIAASPPAQTNTRSGGPGDHPNVAAVPATASAPPRQTAQDPAAPGVAPVTAGASAAAVSPIPVQNAATAAAPIFEHGAYQQYPRAASPVPAVIADPHRAKVYAQVGDDYMRLGKYQQALEFYGDALSFAPADERIKEKIARARVAQATQ